MPAILQKLFGAEKDFSQKLKRILHFSPGNLNLYRQALRHTTRSQKIRSDGFTNSNERLEYLGDAVLNLVVADMLFLKYPFKAEGYLTQMRSKIVNRQAMNMLARKTGLDQLVVLDERNFAHPNGLEMAYGNAMEALIGAVYLDKGYLKTKVFILKTLISNHMSMDELEQTTVNFKSRLLEWAQREEKKVVFEETEVVKNGRHKLRKAVVMVDGEVKGEGIDHVKKKAEQQAAEKACETIGV